MNHSEPPAPSAGIVYFFSPTESVLTRRGDRHPALAQHLVKAGYRVHYVSSGFYHAEKRHFSEAEITEAQQRVPYGLEILPCIGYPSNISIRRVLNNILLSLRAYRYLAGRLTPADLLILPSRPVESVFMAACLRRFRRCQVLLDIEDTWPDALVVRNPLARFVFRTWCNLLLRPSLRTFDLFVHICPSFTEWLRRYNPGATSRFISLGYDPARWQECRPRSGQPVSTPRRLVCVGQLQFQVDVMPILEALRRLPGYSLTIIGDEGKGQRYREVTDYIAKHKLTNVEIIGVVPREKVASLLQDQCIGVIPIVTSLVPNKLFDYVASYLPTLVLGCEDTGRIVSEHGIGWHIPLDAEATYEFLRDLTDAEIGTCRKRVETARPAFNREHLYDELEMLIRPHVRLVPAATTGTTS